MRTRNNRRIHTFVCSSQNVAVFFLSLLAIHLLRTKSTADALALPSSGSNSIYTGNKPIRRVAIVGSGIAGLTTAHALVTAQKEDSTASDIDVTVFDCRKGLDRGAGAGIQLNGALAVLGMINPDLQRAVLDAGQTLEVIRSRSKAWDPEAKPYETLLELPLREVIGKAGGEAKKALLQNDGKDLMWTSIMRGTLQEELYEALPSKTKSKVKFGKMLTGILPCEGEGDENGGVTCVFEDGTRSGPFDLVVGADGIKSAVKEYVDKGRISSDPSKREGAAAGIYTGLRIRYAVRDGDVAGGDEELPCITQYFGDAAYCFSGVFGAGKDRPNTKCAFTTFLDEDYFGPFQLKKPQAIAEENADWTQDVRKSVDASRQMMLQQIRACSVPELELKETVENADRFFELGVYAHNPFCDWYKGIPNSDGSFAVLVGDAAHALPPFLGQGANQAIQDAYSLGSRIQRYNEQVTIRQGAGMDDVEEGAVTLESVLKDYEKTRWPAAFQIFWKATFLGYLETGGFSGFYAKFRDLFFKTMGTIGVASYILLNAATPTI